MPLRINFKSIEGRPKIKPPKRVTRGSAGWDLYSPGDYEIAPGQNVEIGLGFSCELPFGYWAKIRSRSSRARKRLIADAGVMDNDYTGEWVAVMANYHTSKTHFIKKGDRIAQFTLELMPPDDMIVVCDDETQENHFMHRGTGGFGSTGIQ